MGLVDGGMSLRDYLAAAALSGLMVNLYSEKQPSHKTRSEWWEEEKQKRVRTSYKMADAMLDERVKTEEPK